MCNARRLDDLRRPRGRQPVSLCGEGMCAHAAGASLFWHALCICASEMKNLRVALSASNGRISPVFDTAQKLLLADVADGWVAARTEADMHEQPLACRAARLRDLGANVLLCGAVTRPLAAMIAASGIEVMPFLAGEVEDVLAGYLAGELPSPRFMMPGCPCPARGRYRKRGQRGGSGHRRGRCPM